MIKSLIILVLAVLLCGGAYLSRPSEADFREYLAEHRKTNAGNTLSDILGGWRLESELSGSVFKDRYLWVTVEQGGRTAFVGAFSNFWPTKATGAGAAPVDDAQATGVKAVETPPAAPAGKPAASSRDPAARWPN